MIQPDTRYPHHKLIDFTEGDVYERNFKIDQDALQHFAVASGDYHPLHINRDFAKSRGYRDVLVHGMCLTARCSAFVTEVFVGSHGLLVSMNADFRLPVFCDDLLTWHAEVQRIETIAKTIEVKWTVLNEHKVLLLCGTSCSWLGGDE